MAMYEEPPFQRGTTLANGNTAATTDFPQWAGKRYIFPNYDWTSTPYKIRASGNNDDVVCIACRNVSGVALLPGKTASAKVDHTGGYQVDGYGYTTAQSIAGIIDEFLPAAGVANGDVFWLQVGGEACILTDLAAGANNLLPAGTVLVALTAVTSQSTTAGRVAPQDVTGATTALSAQLQNAIGVALSALTTANTNARILTRLIRRW